MHVPGRGDARRGDPRGGARSSAGRGWSRRTAGSSTRAPSTDVSAVAHRRGLPARQVRGGPGAGLRPDAAVRAGDVDRLQATRLRLLDLYGQPCRLTGAGCMVADPAMDPWRPRPFVVTGVRRDTADTVTLDLDGGRRRRHWTFAPGQFTMLYAFGVGRGADLDQRRPGAAGPARAHHPRRRRGHRGLCAAAPADVLGVRGPFGSGWPVPTAAAATSWSSPAASASRRCARHARAARGPRQRYGAGHRALRRPHARGSALRRRAASAGRRPGSRWR